MPVPFARGLSAILVLLLAGCAALDEPWRGVVLSPAPEVREAVQACARHFAALDAAVERAGVRDAQAHRLRGFPYLRVDRFHASLRAAAAQNEESHAQWLSRLQALDHAARRLEISNLPQAEIHALQPAGAARAVLIDTTARCADVLRGEDQLSDARRELIGVRAQVPDDYIDGYRLAGLYALTRIPFAQGIAQWHRETLRDFQRTAESREAALPLTRYSLAGARSASSAQIAAMIKRASGNPLRIPQYTDAEQALLASTFAPVFEVESGGAYDRIGRVHWGTGAGATPAPAVDGAAPVVYQRIAFTRYKGETLTQIVYTAWFSERPHDHALDLLAGKLDGVMLRVTLSAQGEPLLYDSIHPCGCYHLFLPTARVQPLPAPDGAVEWAFIPATLPAHGAGTRIALRIATRSHYVTGVSLHEPADAISYILLAEDELRSLPVDGGMRSLYAPNGLVPGTERAERWLFWPMGIASAGAMRQWGRHATAFVGRRHFDDADLIEKRFRIVAP